MPTLPDRNTVISFLSGVSLFSKADREILEKLAEKTVFGEYATDSNIVKKGDIGETMYLIFSGKLKVHDEEHQVATLNKGDFFGELSLLDREPRSMSVSAIENTVLGGITRDAFYEVLEKYPEITGDIIAVLNQRLRRQNEVLVNEFRGRENQLKELVKLRTEELELKNKELEITLDELKKSQQMLIQNEKLASLGQLTAGIAHEIKNPLNFVNNFSQLSADLLEELKAASTEEEKEELLSFLKINLGKINQHGKQADAIVKNMLEHTRAGTGQRQPIDINKLCMEYYNLAYSNMIAHNPDFACQVQKNLSELIAQTSLVAKDISRVFLNIFNNAFYAMEEKKAKLGDEFEPAISITTSFSDNSIQIVIKDNGVGIPPSLLDKIFQPFFTTKPPGKGTGLGLSLSYDIIKSHQGEIRVESLEGEGTEFTVILPGKGPE